MSKGKFHINPATGRVNKCEAVVSCRFGAHVPHFDTQWEAMKHYEESQGSALPSSSRKTAPPVAPAPSGASPANRGLREKLLAQAQEHYPSRYPEQVLRHLSLKLEVLPAPVLLVLPAGSHLYNTALPGVPTHDYDFTVVAEPHSSNDRISTKQEGELDYAVVGAHKIDLYIRRSSSLSETMLALNSGAHPLYRAGEEQSPWVSYLANYRPSEHAHYDLLDDCIRSASQQYTEPVTRDNRVEFKNFKHQVRWFIYQQRWGSGQGLDPRLTAAERKSYLRILSEGRLSPYLSGRAKL